MAKQNREQTPNPERLKELQLRIEELTMDIGSVLHAITTTFFMVQQALELAIRALGPNPFGSERTVLTVKETDAALTQPARQAARSLEKLLPILAERPELIAPELLEDLAGFAADFADFIVRFPIEQSRTTTLRTMACSVQDILADMPPGKLPREPLRNTNRAVREVERLAALAELLKTLSAITQMDHTIRSLREFVIVDQRRPEPPCRLLVADLIESAHHQLNEYAHSSGIKIKTRHEAAGAMVEGVARKLIRAFANLLHNAIKYTWHREAGKPPWVGIRIYRQDQEVCIAFENWGVPISKDEIKHNLIFDLGYRGKLATDRGRLGTGVGLTDARDITEKHGGRLLVDSRPARSWGPDDPEHDEYYEQPFLTIFTVCLPEAL